MTKLSVTPCLPSMTCKNNISRRALEPPPDKQGCGSEFYIKKNVGSGSNLNIQIQNSSDIELFLQYLFNKVMINF